MRSWAIIGLVCLFTAGVSICGNAQTATQAVPAGNIDKLRLMTAARLGGDYLVRHQRPDGSFNYWYDPLSEAVSTDGYNILRHAGTTVSLLDLHAAIGEQRYLESARKALLHLQTRFRKAKGGAVYVLDLDGKAKLGANGLALIGLARYLLQAERPQKGFSEDAPRLAKMILSLQRPDGSFESYHRIKGDEPSGSVSLYYPGEAMLGLLSLYKLNGDGSLLGAVRRGADYLIKAQQGSSERPLDAWFMQVLEILHQLSAEERYARHTLALAEVMMAGQYDAKAGDQKAGGFGPGEPRAAQAASRAEGLLAAYRLSRVVGDSRAAGIAAVLKASVRFQLSQQYSSANSEFLANPLRAAGGFRESPTSGRVRIDFVQHNISALLGVAENLF
jgi:hypothetical protein